MHEVNGGEVVSDPVAHISISGVHGRDELAARLKNAGRMKDDDDSGLGRIIAGMLIGAAAMYLLDPNRGARRRSLVRDKLTRAGHVSSDRLEKLGRDLKNRATGVVAETRGRFRSGDVDDAVLVERVRSEIGHIVAHPGSIVVTAMDGEIMLSGPVLRSELDRLLGATASVRGVRGVQHRLEVHDSSGNIPGLQDGD